MAAKIISIFTTQKDMPTALKEHALIAKHTTDMVCLHDAENVIRFATPSSRAVLGYEASGLLGKKLTDFLTDSFINEMDFSTLMRFFDQPGARIRYQILHGDNRLRWLETTFTKISEPEFVEYHILSTTRDITESVHLTDDLMQALSKEQELSKLKTNLYSVASHEFKTPLAVIQANLEMLKFKQSPRLLETGLAAMEEEVDHLNLMIEDMLKLKKLTLGRRNFNSAPEDLELLLKDLIISWKDKEIKGLQMQLDVQGQAQPVSIDYSMIRYVFSNLISNAIKFSPEKGAIKIGIIFNEVDVEVTVEDQGIGIPEDEQNAIFQSFYRAKNADNIPGTGVGLSIVSEFIKLHKGKIKVNSIPGKGSTFMVSLPIKTGIV